MTDINRPDAGMYLTNRHKPCEQCGGDEVTHLAVIHSLFMKTGVKISLLLDMPCTLVNRLHKAMMEVERAA